jgi:hypothetical protein
MSALHQIITGYAQGGGGDGSLPVPAGLVWTPPISVYRSAVGVYSTNYDPSPILAEGGPGVTTYYVDADTGSESNPGTSALPKASLRTITSSGMGAASKLLVKARGKFYAGITGSSFNYAGTMQFESWGGAECRITMETSPAYPWVWTNETGGVWSSPIPASWFGYTTVLSGTNPATATPYPQAATLAACQATAGTSIYQAGTPNKYFVHTLDGTSPATGHILLGGVGNACESLGRGYAQRIMYRGVDFIGGDAAFAITGVDGGLRRHDFIGCRFWHGRTNAALHVDSDSKVYSYQCTAGPSKFDGFAYSATQGSPGQFVEIECLGINAGYVSTGANQGSTIHSGVKILRVNGQYYGNSDQQIADVNANTASWNLGCTIGPERFAGSDGIHAGNDGGNTQMYLDGCSFAGMTYQIRATANTHVWFTNMAAPTTAVSEGTGLVTDYAGVVVPSYTPPIPPVGQPAITAINANFTVAASPVAGWTRITKVAGTAGTMERAATSTQLQPGWSVFMRDVAETAAFRAGVSKLAGPYGDAGLYGGGYDNSGNTYFRFYNAGTYAAYITRSIGSSYGVSRRTAGTSDGYPGTFIGDDPTVADFSTIYGLGATEAGNPVIFDCAISGIGHYIDVKIT